MLDVPHDAAVAPSFPAGDYVSVGLRRVQPDACFPFMHIRGEADKAAHSWPYLRREIPHNYYADQRSPNIGFVSRDEAHILFNTALMFRGQRTLEIGCWLGWSACHLALAGVELDVVDPILAQPDFYGSVTSSLCAAGVNEHVHLIPGGSPAEVLRLHNSERRSWGLIFIDGNHDRPGPLQDAQAAHIVAAPNALVLFHDLASPEVTEGLSYLRDQGWQTMIYQTMQIMGVAWRGTCRPLHHVPDPAVVWPPLPDHLKGYKVSGAA